jgi:TonB family protein
MNIPEEFGNYLLLKKLREDALGETFRGGRVGRDGIEQVVLLRVFNGPGIDGEKLWQRVSGRAAVQQALRSPNIGSGVDLGKVRSFPYAAYDYVSGKNLATLFAQAARQRQPIPVDHALLISERVALALAAAYETRVQDERVLHGFVVPHLVMISNEGETRLLGFEVAPGLRELWAAGWRADDLRGYLAPEASGGAAVGKADDVYSLGAILFELLASERLPLAPPGAAGYGPLIDAMVLPNEGTPLPEGIAALLKKSLVPSAQRIPDAITWHKTLSKLMIEGHYTSTTFNLAFFMHNLFRDEIDRESQEIEAERKLELPRRGAPAGAAGTAAGAVPMLGGAGAAAAAGSLASSGAVGAGPGAAAGPETRERTGVRGPGWAAGAAAAGAGAARGDRKLLWIGLAAAAALALAAGGYLLFGRGGGARPAAQPGGAAATAGAGASTAADAARKATALQAQVQQMIEARSKELETKLKSQYDDNIKQLQQKLEESRRAAAQEKEKEKARAERQAASGGSLSEAATPPPSASGESRAARGERAETPAPAASSAAGGSQRATAPAAQSSPAAAAAAQREPAGTAPAPAATAQAALVTPSVPVGSATAPASGGHQPQLQVGDLVEPGASGAVPPKLLYKAPARYPAAAKRMNRTAEVLVRVLVNQDGKVERAEREGAEVGLGFDEAAIEAARHSNYQPAIKDGVRVRMWVLLKVAFASPG